MISTGFTDILAELESENALTIRVNFMSQPVAEPFNLSYGKEMREKFKGEFVRFSGYNPNDRRFYKRTLR